MAVLVFANDRQQKILRDVLEERQLQEEIGRRKRSQGLDWRSCADPEMVGGDDRRSSVLGEEYGEVCKAVLEAASGELRAAFIKNGASPETADLVIESRIRDELVQVAAVAVAWIEAIDARTRP